MKFTRRTALAASAAATTTAALAACGSSTGSSGGGGEGGDVELTVATFNEFGYEELFPQYEEENPGVKIVHRKAASSEDARANLMSGLAAGSGLADVEGIEVRSEEHTSELQSRGHLVCRLLLEKKNNITNSILML